MESFKLNNVTFEHLTLLPFFFSFTVAQGRHPPVLLPSTGKPADRMSWALTNPQRSVSTWEMFAF